MLDMIPGDARSVDMTQYLLEHSYYFCVNRPITSHVAKRSGLIDDEDSNKHSSSHGHGNREKVPESSNGHIVEIESPRGQPFREQLPKVQSVGDLMRFMRSNDYLSHPSPGGPGSNRFGTFTGADEKSSPINYPACRYDLIQATASRRFYGTIDAKITSTELIQLGATLAVNGPMAQSPNIPPFGFEKKPWVNPYTIRDDQKYDDEDAIPEPKHVGTPDVFSFDWVVLRPAAPIRTATGFD
eukprot:c10109_g1_i4.p1 GENE.c10109_g1_i4~~c10109_g1_i4.p1  ORF type:complete len:241 (-),score=76.70 c10109_g1_i4:127-849(-)